jgi:hypothetical protein
MYWSQERHSTRKDRMKWNGEIMRAVNNEQKSSENELFL